MLTGKLSAMWALLLACAAPEPAADTAEVVVPDAAPEPEACDALELRVDGPEPPAVGDSWTLWLWCEDALMTGAQRVSLDPPDFATVDTNVVTFRYAGSGTVTLQVGRERQSREVQVEE